MHWFIRYSLFTIGLSCSEWSIIDISNDCARYVVEIAILFAEELDKDLLLKDIDETQNLYLGLIFEDLLLEALLLEGKSRSYLLQYFLALIAFSMILTIRINYFTFLFYVTCYNFLEKLC